LSVLHTILFLAAGAAVSPQPAFLRAPSAQHVEAGANAEITWKLDTAATRDLEEMELLLSLDGGGTFPIRVTRDLSPETRSFSWRVPLLPTAHARLALRTGESGDEEIALVSNEFAIEADAATPLEPTARIEGEWRTRDALDGGAGHRPLDPPGLARDSGTIGSLPRLSPAVSPKPPLAPNRGGNDSGRLEASTRPAAPAMLPPLSRVPASAPMRE
jgi:hypothetical protein